jgi:hypothetical protein
VVTTIFQTLAEKAEAGQLDVKNVVAARAWYREEASKIQRINPNKLIDNKNTRNSLDMNNIGQMFMFFYNPKNKDTLPYYDRFPLVFPVDIYQDGFLGINLHYLPLRLRANLMDALYMTINNKKNDTTTRLQITYNILKSSSRMRYFKPCLKRYLADHVLQRFMYIDPKDWDKALMLPTERFSKQSKQYVHTESVRSIRGK